MMAFVGIFVFKVDHVHFLLLFFNHFVLDPFNQVSKFGVDGFFNPLFGLEAIIGMVTFLFVKLTILA